MGKWFQPQLRCLLGLLVLSALSLSLAQHDAEHGGTPAAAQESIHEDHAAVDEGALEQLNSPLVVNSLAADLLILFGSFFILAAAIGILRFPDFYTRLHASTKLVTLGGIGILIGAAFAFDNVQISQRIILIIVFFFLTAPLSGYMIARAGYLRGLPFYKEHDTQDEWQALGSVSGISTTSPEQVSSTD
ncbi:MAG: monovalent cation/H(+) antiporter subunit G [Deinococcota bacterium]